MDFLNPREPVNTWSHGLWLLLVSHELFHLFVVAGSLSHFWFMLAVVVPFVYEPETPMPPVDPTPRALPSAFGAPRAPG
jgi:hypothetical protein